jgi:hypothetical protein
MNIAHAAATCTVNGEQVACPAGLGIGMLIFAIVMFALGIFFFVFWIKMIIHAASNPVQNKALWIVLMVLFGVLGAIIYYFVVKKDFVVVANVVSPQI